MTSDLRMGKREGRNDSNVTITAEEAIDFSLVLYLFEGSDSGITVYLYIIFILLQLKNFP